MTRIIVIITALFMAMFLLTSQLNSVNAGGDKVRGDNSDGPSNQNGECPFYG